MELPRCELTHQFSAIEHHEPEGGNKILTEKEAFDEMRDAEIDPATLGEDSDIMNSPDPKDRGSPSTDSEYHRSWGKSCKQRLEL
jgi:hypothetical protein